MLTPAAVADAAEQGACPDADTALRYLGGELRERADALERHIDQCAECRALFAELARTSLAVARPSPTESGPAPLGDFLPVGTTIHRYRITGLLGRGGMGVVYDADDLELERPVALKVLRRELSETAQARLLAEARASSRLSHPNIRGVFHIGVVEERLFLALERIEGDSLDAWLRRGDRSVREILDVFRAAGQGLAATHRIGVVHRDFKPANVLVDGSGRAVVCDFGLATEHADAEVIGGTPRYMAPEQRAGGGDHRVDQYAFGVSLDDALEGRAVARRVRDVVARARAERAEDRYPDMEALLDALDRARRPSRVPVALGVVGIAVVLGLASIGNEPDDDAPVVAAAGEQTVAEAEAVEPGGIDPRIKALLDVAEGYGEVLDWDGMGTIADLAVAEAKAIGDPIGEVAAMEYQARNLLVRNDELAIERGEKAFFVAVERGASEVGARAAVDIIPALTRLGRIDEALEWSRHAEGKLGDLSAVPAKLRAEFERSVGMTLMAAGSFPEAQQRLEGALELARSVPTPDKRTLYTILTELGMLYRGIEKLDTAVERSREAVRLAGEVNGTDHPEYAHVLAYHALVLGAAGQGEEALDALLRARAIVVASGAGGEALRVIEIGIGTQLLENGRYEEARTKLRELVSQAAAEDPTRCTMLYRLGQSFQREGRCKDGRADFLSALDCYRATMGPESKFAVGVQKALDACGE